MFLSLVLKFTLPRRHLFYIVHCVVKCTRTQSVHVCGDWKECRSRQVDTDKYKPANLSATSHHLYYTTCLIQCNNNCTK